MTLGGIIVIVAGLLVAAIGWAASKYSAHQIATRRSQLAGETTIRKGDAVTADVDLAKDIPVTAAVVDLSKFRIQPGAKFSVIERQPARRRGVLVPRDPSTGELLKELPVKSSDENLLGRYLQ